jgi:hypothetical protein
MTGSKTIELLRENAQDNKETKRKKRDLNI